MPPAPSGQPSDGPSGPAGPSRDFNPAVVIPAFGRIEATRRCLASLRSAGIRRPILVDDCGTAGGDVLVRDFEDLDVVRTETPVWWSGGIVQGIDRALARGDRSFLLFNQDVTVAPDYFERLERTARAHPAALVGSTVLYSRDPGCVWSAGGRVEWFGRGVRVCYHGSSVDRLPAEPFDVDWLPGMGTLVSEEILRAAGTLDAKRFPMAWGDADFSMRVRERGIRVIVDPAARLMHDVGDYDPRVAGAPPVRTYLRWLRDPRHNISLSAQAEIWRRHGPKGLWPLSFAMRVAVLLANFVRIRARYPRGRVEAERG
jgi:GT2 family glycosyltransferase